MACGCGRGKTARPASTAGVTPTVNVQTRQSANATVIAPSSPYSKTQVPPHLAATFQRRTV